ncbi:ABC transporter ATP-binding protein [Caloranaerobacter ferrireducens]|uniref:ABC transporter ATP-binding protein n=1 Tax=Caloranaerobacter ferrireducens TaxID=1323370 RepID=UPI00084DF726|nr:ABC transporter ATP-binding protein [Caloranaerobacter ferrireducens]
MLKLIKYLKPFTGLIMAAILLLFAQAMADLSLPDYMSNIVNNGIQQGGIVNAVPEAIRESQMNKLTIFMKPEDINLVMDSYTLITKSSKDYAHYVELYPALKNEPIYVLNNIGQSKIDELNPIMGKAILVVSGINKMKSEAKGGMINFNGNKIPANADLFSLFKNLPQEQRTKISDKINKQFTALGNKMIVQAAVGPIKTEYEALGVDTEKIQTKYIFNTGIKMLLISLISALCIVGVGFLASKTAAGLARNLRIAVFTKVQSFSKAELDKFSTASLITRTTNDITQIQMLIVIIIRMVFYAPIMAVGGIIKALDKSQSMSWVIGVAIIALLILIITVFLTALPKFRVIQKLIDRLNLITRENLSGMMVIRAFNNQDFEEKRFDQANKNLTNTNLFVNRIMAVMFPTMMLIMNGITLLIVWVGAHQIANSSMQVGDMMAFMQYAMQIIFAFLMMSFMFIMIPRASVAAQRIAEVLDTEVEIKDPKNPKSPNKNLKGVVEFKNVSFRYPGAEEDVLKNISFKALPGETTAIIGSTGSGKSTLVNLILRFYDVTDGQVLVDGVDVREITQNELRDKIGYVPQKSSLFSGTIESNLKYANENASEVDLKEAADIAQAMEFIKEKADGFKTKISQGGTNLSGGQKQRLSIARALVKKPEIFIFDDSFSALDFKTAAALRKALKEKTKSSTIILVAQRISTVMNAEQIIVLDEGRIVGKGTHKELMESCKTYQEIALSQLSKEELA